MHGQTQNITACRNISKMIIGNETPQPNSTRSGWWYFVTPSTGFLSCPTGVAKSGDFYTGFDQKEVQEELHKSNLIRGSQNEYIFKLYNNISILINSHLEKRTVESKVPVLLNSAFL